MEKKYYAFISYSRKNSKAAAYLHKQLEHFRIPVKYVAEENRPAGQKFLRPVFRDRRDLESRGNSFTEDIKAALEHSRHLIVVCSPMSATSVWVNEEIKHFLATHNNDYSAIVPIILNGEPGSGDDTECLPEALRVKEITIRKIHHWNEISILISHTFLWIVVNVSKYWIVLRACCCCCC